MTITGIDERHLAVATAIAGGDRDQAEELLATEAGRFVLAVEWDRIQEGQSEAWAFGRVPCPFDRPEPEIVPNGGDIGFGLLLFDDGSLLDLAPSGRVWRSVEDYLVEGHGAREDWSSGEYRDGDPVERRAA